MSDAPDWLQTTTAPAPASTWEGQPAAAAPAAAAPGPAAAAPAATPSLADDPDLPQVILMMRLANMGVAAGLMGVSVGFIWLFCALSVVAKQHWFLTVYAYMLPSLTFFSDLGHCWSPFRQCHCFGSVRDNWRLPHLLFGNPTQIPPRHDCRQLWFPLQLGVALLFLLFARICGLELR